MLSQPGYNKEYERAREIERLSRYHREALTIKVSPTEWDVVGFPITIKKSSTDFYVYHNGVKYEEALSLKAAKLYSQEIIDDFFSNK